MNDKENLLAFYRGQAHDRMPFPGKGEANLYPVNGFWERPPYNKGGKDWFGCAWEFMEAAGAPAPDCSVHLLDDICDWRDVITFPDLDAWDWDEAVRLDKIAEVDRADNLYNVVILSGLWERTHMLLGFENALCSLIEEPEEMAALFDAMTEYKIALIDKVAEHYHPDVITFHDDWGTQNGPFFDPNTWRELIKPRQARIIEAAHAHGIIFEQHSCGKYDAIIPDIEEIGVDILQCMDINDISAALAATTKMRFVVSVHTQEYFAKDAAGTLTEQEVRQTAAREFTEWAKSGRYMAFARDGGKWYEAIVLEELEKVCAE